MKKTWLPHLFYGSVLLAVGLFYADKIGRAERVNRLLAEPVSPAIAAVKELNREKIHLVEASYLDYINPVNLQFLEQAEAADSLTQLALFNLKNMDKTQCEEAEDLKNAWFGLVEADDRDYFNQFLHDNFINNPDCPARKNSFFEVAGNQNEDSISSKADSLLFTISESWLLNYFLRKVSGGCRFYSFEPALSLTNPAPAVGDTVRADVFLSANGPRMHNAEIDGYPIQLNSRYQKAHLKKRFDQPGLWPIHSRFRFSTWVVDSLNSCEKTFFIRVKN